VPLLSQRGGLGEVLRGSRHLTGTYIVDLPSFNVLRAVCDDADVCVVDMPPRGEKEPEIFRLAAEHPTCSIVLVSRGTEADVDSGGRVSKQIVTSPDDSLELARLVAWHRRLSRT